jgi:hypothetical protein
MEETLAMQMLKGDYWQVASNNMDVNCGCSSDGAVNVPDGQDCVISFVDTRGKRYLVCHFDFDWVDGFLDVLASLVARYLETDSSMTDLQTLQTSINPGYGTTAGWITSQVVKRCPPMQILFSDQPNAYGTPAKRYVTALMDNETHVVESMLKVFEWQGPGHQSRFITVEDLQKRWKKLSSSLVNCHATMKSAWLCESVLRGC